MTMRPAYAVVAGMVPAATLLVLSTGCWQSTGTDRGAALAAGTQYLLAAEPADAQSVAGVRALLEEQKGPADVVLCGRVGGLSQPTWDPERAAFMVTDLSLAPAPDPAQAEHDETPKHDAENCPFCHAKQKKELAGLARIEVLDAAGAIPPVDARKLLGLKDGQVVVVRGRAEIDKLDTVVVRTSGIYVRP